MRGRGDWLTRAQLVNELVSQDPTGRVHAMGIWLHALWYKSDSWRFESPVPDWAKPTAPDAVEHGALGVNDLPVATERAKSA